MKRFEILIGLSLLCAVLMFGSCVKDDIDAFNLQSQGQELRFEAGQSQEDADMFTRSGEAKECEEAPQTAVYELEGDEDFEQPLYLHMTSEKREAPAAEAMATRGTPVTSNEAFISTYGAGGFGLFSYAYPATEPWDNSKYTSEYVHNQPVKYRSAYKYWAIHNPSGMAYYHWPGPQYKIRFYAYAPYAGQSNYYTSVIKADATAYTGVPTLKYVVSNANLPTVGTSKTNHPDFLIAKFEEDEDGKEISGDMNSVVNLNFKHALAAVSFKIGGNVPAGTITDFKITGIYREAKIDLSTQEWSDYSNIGFTRLAKRDVNEEGETISVAKSVEIGGVEGENITEIEETFMMLPQVLPDDAMIVIDFTDENNNTSVIKGKIGGVEWKMGYHYTYYLNDIDYVFNVDTEMVKNSDGVYELSDTYLGGAQTSWTIKSYKIIPKSSQATTSYEAASWKTQVLVNNQWVDAETMPEIFSKFTVSDAGSFEAKKHDAEMAPIVPDDPLNPFVDEEDREEGSSVVNLYDNNCGNKWWSSNCYVINKAGYYKFPVVYGNAVMGASVNSTAYAGCVDYKGNPIESPYIHSSGTLGSAKLLWSDAPQLVTEVELSSAEDIMTVAQNPVRYITFRVPGASLAPGNAVIALYDTAGNIMWSWHIWVTKWSGGSVSVTSNSKSFNFATEILGYCPARNATWNQREVTVRFKQVDSDKVSETYLFKQDGETIQYSEGTMPYYQWGRKDPMLPYNYITKADGTATGGKEKVCYGLPLTQRDDMWVWDDSVYNPDTGGYGDYVSYTYKGYFPITYKVGSAQTSGAAMSESIQNPHTFYARHMTSGSAYGSGVGYDWCNQASYNRWDAANKANIATDSAKGELATVKTIYDPCPAGWCVPPVGAFYGFTSAGGATAMSPSKTTLSSDDVTPAFQVTAKGGNVVKLPVAGDRNRFNGAPWWNVNEARSVQLWTSTPAVKSNATCAYFVKSGSSYFYNLSSGPLGKSSGFAVLPVKEH